MKTDRLDAQATDFRDFGAGREKFVFHACRPFQTPDEWAAQRMASILLRRWLGDFGCIWNELGSFWAFRLASATFDCFGHCSPEIDIFLGLRSFFIKIGGWCQKWTENDTGALKMSQEAVWARSGKSDGGRAFCQMEVGGANCCVN